ncbi:hypothetical protein OSB04_006122 [Centaurea solstitialis]|uniref:Phospholipase D alpha 1 n=1 Tax=Centaurea solstitialis TaxID=347529 RepID=A0AA38WH50_9ASTR|nr:hypothetical protein OSB04_006122 [Centaurea solstitialis]
MSGLRESQHLKLKLQDIQLATKNFETCIGKGGYGSVYKGQLSVDGKPTTVAVKRLNEQFGQGLKEFLTEIQLLTGQNHPNLISLLGYCDDGEEKIIVYEYAEHGSLDRYLNNTNRTHLTWRERLRICIEAARGLDHLHNHVKAHQTIIHRDIKSSNILLDENWVAKISDLGLSKLSLAGLDRSLVVTNPAGTYGYVEPESIDTGIVKKESDVYSFGVVLFEVLCGRLCLSKHDDGILLSARLAKDYYENKKLIEIIDPRVREEMSLKSMNKFSAVAYGCLQDDRGRRPNMELVVKELIESLKIQVEYELEKEKKLKQHHHVGLELDDDGSKKVSSATSTKATWGKLQTSHKKAEQVKTMAEIGYQGSQHGEGVEIIPFKTSNEPLKVILLHGYLNIWVKEAKNLPNMDMFYNKVGQVLGKLLTFSGKSKTNDGKSQKVTSGPYVTISIANVVIARTFVIRNSENPIWLQDFYVPVAYYSTEVHFVVKHSDLVGSKMIGAVGIPVGQLVSGSIVEGTFPILNGSGKPCRPGAVLTLRIQYTPLERVPLSQNGVGSDPNFNGVLGTYFPLRRGGKVTLYQDAHVDDGCLPSVWLDGGLRYEHGECWHDICEAIKQARHLIYIIGWSVFHSIQLVRNGEEGVRVLLLIWDDPTSTSIFGFKSQGIMQTNDEETRRFFKNSSVQVLLCSRSTGSWATKEVATIYTHHQKTVIVDADAGNHKRRIMAFVGGLDLCEGRYDTPEHPLFSTLQTVHKDDYHQPSYPPTNGCPREPWHDLHSRIEGPAAYDVLTNFEERWLRASKPRGIRNLMMSVDGSLLKLDWIPDILGIDDAHCTSEQDPNGWHVQVFRSIDSNSVKGFPNDPKDATSKNLVCGKNVLIDLSIHTAYVKAIRAAQHFIYIENQYFLGSSFNWSTHKTLGANNLIPMEIALKIANKIRVKERFVAYIVIPMWPEGIPTSSVIQRILFWQNKTMQMMYEVIYKALQEVGLENVYEPQDYLLFFCLGTRESSKGDEPTSDEEVSKAASTPQSLSRRNRRFMIYVHSKGMIVDDEFVILGSANINQRSLDGSRDTEIAMGAYQPYHTWAYKRNSPHGQIFGYRMSLWAEHIGGVESCFERPESLECVRRVRLLSELNWKQYAAVEVSDMKGHLLKYPVEVDRTGQVKPLPDCPSFPDLGGNIVGTSIDIQENLTS